ncbi:MAG: antibiotic biosynthesis monooxygenase family protein, partial [Candidatus Aminicenantales bacterium]
VVPEAKAQKGYCGLYLFIDRQSGKGVSISLWDSEKEAVANEKSRYYQEQVAKFIAFYAKPPIREGYEVSVFEGKAFSSP